MAWELFGFQLNKKKQQEQQQPTVIAPSGDDGSTVLSTSAAAYYSQVVDLDTSIKNENDLIKRYREVSLYTEVDAAIEDIVNEAICFDEEGNALKLNLDKLKVGNNIKKRFQEEFEEIQYLFLFHEKAHDMFRNWYVDGRAYYVITLDPEHPKEGIVKLDYVDSRKIRKIKKIEKRKDKDSGVDVVVKVDEFYIYNEKGIENSSATGIKLSLDSVLFAPSGVYDQNSMMVLSHLHKAIKPANQLKMLEDATVINRLVRAPQRRIFYIDVGNLPKLKAEQYVTDIMNKYKNKIVYDASTGEVRDDRKHMSMLEDFWMPRREGGKGTEITTLDGGESLSQLDDVNYFQRKLYQSLNVPISRLVPDQNFSIGKSNEITRDELKFHKFISRLRHRFSNLLLDALKVQLVAKNVVTLDDWKEIEKDISVEFISDNSFEEMKEAELLNNRFAMLQQVDPFVGKWFGPEFVYKKVLKLTDEEIDELNKDIEGMNERFVPMEQKQMEAQQQAQEEAAMNPEPDPENPTPPPFDGEVNTGPTRPPIQEELSTELREAELNVLNEVVNYLKKGD